MAIFIGKEMKHLFITILAITTLAGCHRRPSDVAVLDALPSIYPDYIGVTIPAEIAPLNFCWQSDSIQQLYVVVRGSKRGELHVQGEWADFPLDEWHALTTQNLGGHLTFTVSARLHGQWRQYRPFTVSVSASPLSEWGLTYRRIAPGYEVYSKMGLYQRQLSTFREYAILENTQVPGMCVNCHTAHQTDPSRFVFHVRGDHGATLFQLDGRREWLQARNDLLGGSMVYPYWHPSGRFCAFSTNQTRQGYHVVRDERIEVFDLSSDVLVYDPSTHEILTDSLLRTKEWSENSPVFSPDGHTLYFTTCRQQSYPVDYRREQYNLCRISFSPSQRTFGTHVDTLFNAVAMGKSVTWPRPSYDGRFLLFTLQDYGYFSIWHEESDQWLLNLTTGESRPLHEINSPRADSYHNWSLNSRWIVFTSRRDDGLYTRLYLAHVDEQGRFSKPFLLPQRNPKEYYGESIYSFNTPDFTKTKVAFDAYRAGQEITSDRRVETRVRQ